MANLGRLVQFHAADILEIADDLNNHGRQFRQRVDPFELSDHDFIRLFRLNKAMAENLINICEQYDGPIGRQSALDTSVKVLTALRFYASGSYQLDIGYNQYVGVSQSSTSRCIRDINAILNHPDIFNEWVHYPQNIQELNSIRNSFYEKFGMPGVVGCVDCTHIAIFPPNVQDEDYPEYVYVNRKGYHSINTQLICDAKMKILNVNARYPGSSHDSFIWNNSNVLPVMRGLHERGYDNYYLIGDSGYALRPWMHTPLHDPEPHSLEERYNRCLVKTRSIIERCNGLLKMRFRCLLKHRVLHYSPSVASRIVNSCVVLHNMCVENNMPAIEVGDEDLNDFGIHNQGERPIEDIIIGRINPDLVKARRMRRRIINNFFQ